VEPKVNYTAVGLFVLVLAIILIDLIYWLSSGHHKQYNNYLLYMKENVSGLNVKAPVKFNGVNVGHVQEISLDPEDPQNVRILLKIEKGIPITQSSTATLMSEGITGVTYIGIKAKTSKAPLLQKHPGEPYPVIPTEPSLLVQLNDALREVTGDLKKMSDSFRLVLDPQNRAALKNTLNNLSKASNQFPDAMKKIKLASEKLAEASTQIKTTMQDSSVVVKSLSHQTLPEVNQAVVHLKESLNNFKELTSQIKQNPSIIIRGTQPSPPGPGE
jgi:phospholipid/cholesterol/gamma-HCH transport system substrate-binding protein